MASSTGHAAAGIVVGTSGSSPVGNPGAKARAPSRGDDDATASFRQWHEPAAGSILTGLSVSVISQAHDGASPAGEARSTGSPDSSDAEGSFELAALLSPERARGHEPERAEMRDPRGCSDPRPLVHAPRPEPPPSRGASATALGLLPLAPADNVARLRSSVSSLAVALRRQELLCEHWRSESDAARAEAEASRAEATEQAARAQASEDAAAWLRAAADELGSHARAAGPAAAAAVPLTGVEPAGRERGWASASPGMRTSDGCDSCEEDGPVAMGGRPRSGEEGVQAEGAEAILRELRGRAVEESRAARDDAERRAREAEESATAVRLACDARVAAAEAESASLRRELDRVNAELAQDGVLSGARVREATRARDEAQQEAEEAAEEAAAAAAGRARAEAAMRGAQQQAEADEGARAAAEAAAATAAHRLGLAEEAIDQLHDGLAAAEADVRRWRDAAAGLEERMAALSGDGPESVGRGARRQPGAAVVPGPSAHRASAMVSNLRRAVEAAQADAESAREGRREAVRRAEAAVRELRDQQREAEERPTTRDAGTGPERWLGAAWGRARAHACHVATEEDGVLARLAEARAELSAAACSAEAQRLSMMEAARVRHREEARAAAELASESQRAALHSLRSELKADSRQREDAAAVANSHRRAAWASVVSVPGPSVTFRAVAWGRADFCPGSVEPRKPPASTGSSARRADSAGPGSSTSAITVQERPVQPEGGARATAAGARPRGVQASTQTMERLYPASAVSAAVREALAAGRRQESLTEARAALRRSQDAVALFDAAVRRRRMPRTSPLRPTRPRQREVRSKGNDSRPSPAEPPPPPPPTSPAPRRRPASDGLDQAALEAYRSQMQALPSFTDDAPSQASSAPGSGGAGGWTALARDE